MIQPVNTSRASMAYAGTAAGGASALRDGTATAGGSRQSTGIERPGDTVSISPDARERFRALDSERSRVSESTQAGVKLDPAGQRQVEKLRQIDTRVRAHEQAHMAAAGGFGGAVSYTFTTGPDRKQYATGGEVPIDVGPVSGKPRETVQKMQVVERAALAPADPSGQDRAVFAQAAQNEQQARLEEMSGGQNGKTEKSNSNP